MVLGGNNSVSFYVCVTAINRNLVGNTCCGRPCLAITQGIMGCRRWWPTYLACRHFPRVNYLLTEQDAKGSILT